MYISLKLSITEINLINNQKELPNLTKAQKDELSKMTIENKWAFIQANQSELLKLVSIETGILKQ